MRKAVLIGLMLCMSAFQVFACETRFSTLGNFARFPIGMPLKVLPKGIKRLPNCAVYPKHHAFDCEFVDKEGSSFLASGHAIVRVERTLENSSMLPPGYPLRRGMSIGDAAKVLSEANPAMKLTTDHAGTGSSLTTPECLKNRHGSYYLSLGFDKAGGLDGLLAGYDTAEN